MQNNTTKLLSNNIIPTKSSALFSKREQFKNQIRKQYLNQLFATKRKQLVQRNITQQEKQKLLNYVKELLDFFFKSQSYAQAQDIIHKISDQFNREGVNFQDAIKEYSNQLLKMFIMFPKNKHAIQVLYKIISYCYEQTFHVDDNKFCLLHGENVYEVELERKELTECQEAMLVLMSTIDEEIASLGHRYIVKSNNSRQQQSQQSLQTQQHQPLQTQQQHYPPQAIEQHNNRIQRRLKMYLFCFKQIVSKMNSYILRYEFVNQYIVKWTYMLLVEYKFAESCILTYLLFVSRFVVPFRTWIDMKYIENNKQTSNLLTKEQNIGQSQLLNVFEWSPITNPLQQQQLQDQIINKLFTLCIPTIPDSRRDSVPLFSMLIIKSVFMYEVIKIQKVVQSFLPICHLVRVVLNHTSYYKTNAFVNVFELLGGVISRFCIEMINQDTSKDRKQLMQSVNLIDILTDMEFISTFDLYFTSENETFCQPLYQLISQLIEYCMIFNINLSNLLYQKSIFPGICHKLDSRNSKILRINLKSIELICQYASMQKRKEYFSKMVDYGVDERLDHLVYHMDEWVSERAIRLKEIYFSEDQIYDYTALENQLQRYSHQDQEWN